MQLFSRRRVLYCGLSITIPFLSGCFNSEEGLDIIVRNEDTAEHHVVIKVSGDFAERDSEQATLSPDDKVTFDNLVPILDYDHEFEIRIDVDGNVVDRKTYRLNEIKPIEIIVENEESVSFIY